LIQEEREQRKVKKKKKSNFGTECSSLVSEVRCRERIGSQYSLGLVVEI
jgi:hypothetical protein